MKLGQIPYEEEQQLKAVSTDEEVAALGYECKGQLCDYEDYSEFYERLWVCRKVVDGKVYIIVILDNGNCFCSVVYMNTYVKELMEV